MDIETLISHSANIGSEISKLQMENYEGRKERKGNFNFFSAIVSGKNDKQHIEKYHSNFIAYLLDTKASHDFGDLFLKYFFKELEKEPFGIKNLPYDEVLIIERERPTTYGRYIDISLELGKEWIVFIENKIRSGEQPEQMNDYYNFAKGNYSKGIGIYLTLNGDDPGSISEKSDQDDGFTIISLSYNKVQIWIEQCCQDIEIKKHQHILNALEQYINVIKINLKTMNEDTRTIIEFLKENKDKTEIIIKNRRILNESVIELVKEIRENFLECLQTEVNERKEKHNSIPDNLGIHIRMGDYVFSGDENHSFGMGFEITKDEGRFNYGSGSHGECGNAIHIQGINVHEDDGIEKGNAILFMAYKNPDEWKSIINATADKLFEEIETKVLPKYSI